MKKLLKKEYKYKRNEYVVAYDYVKVQAAEAVINQVEMYTLHCNIVDLEVLQAFLDAYIKKAQAEFDKAKLKDKDGHLQLLREILDQCEVLMSA